MGGELGEFSLGVLYAIAVVSGALGGCAAGAFYTRRQQRNLTWALLATYIIFGVVFSVITFTASAVFKYDLDTVHELVLISMMGGFGGSLALFSANWTVKAVFRRLGVELEITLRKRDRE